MTVTLAQAIGIFLTGVLVGWLSLLWIAKRWEKR